MTREEAIKILRSGLFNHDIDINIALNFAIEALEKQMPEKPYTEISKKSDEGYYCCPNCKKHIEVIGFSAYREKYGMNRFCSYCGQAIDWSEEE